MILKRLRRNEVAYTIVFAASLLLVGGGLLYGAYRYSGKADTSSETSASRGSSSAQRLAPVTGKPTPNQQNNSQSSTSSGSNKPTSTPSNTYKPYVPYTCTKTPILYKTTYVNSLGLYVGETISIGGDDGFKSTCTADSSGYKPADYISEPIDKTVYVGTAAKPSSGPTQAELDAARQQRINNCIQYIKRLSSGNAYEQCYYIN